MNENILTRCNTTKTYTGINPNLEKIAENTYRLYSDSILGYFEEYNNEFTLDEFLKIKGDNRTLEQRVDAIALDFTRMHLDNCIAKIQEVVSEATKSSQQVTLPEINHLLFREVTTTALDAYMELNYGSLRGTMPGPFPALADDTFNGLYQSE